MTEHKSPQGVEVWAHRGASSLAPENTLAAGRPAPARGAFGWEVDVRLTQDGVCVLLHDMGLLRTTDFGRKANRRERLLLVTNFTSEEIRGCSAGTTPQDRIFLPVVEVMREIGIDISGDTPKGIKTFLGHYHFERVIIVCGDAEKQCPAIFGMSKREFWPFDDPAAAQGSEQDVLAVTRRVRDQIDGSICEWLQAQGIPVQPLGSL